METLRRAAQQFKDKITKTPLERELIEVTNNDNWAVPSTKLQELAERTNNFDESRVIMRHVWETLKADTKDWRKIYKAMNLIEVILKFGSNSCS